MLSISAGFAQVEAPVQCGVVEEAPVQCGVVEEAPVQCGVVEEAPVQCGVVEDAPVHCGVVEEAPVQCGVVVVEAFEPLLQSFCPFRPDKQKKMLLCLVEAHRKSGTVKHFNNYSSNIVNDQLSSSSSSSSSLSPTRTLLKPASLSAFKTEDKLPSRSFS